MKELTGLSNQFSKISNEAKTLQERMGALYEDMGKILGRYYLIGEETKESQIKEGDYEGCFQAEMKKFGISSPDEWEEDKKKEIVKYVDKNCKEEIAIHQIITVDKVPKVLELKDLVMWIPAIPDPGGTQLLD